MKPLKESEFNFKYIGLGLALCAIVTFAALFLIAVIMFYADISGSFSSPLASIGLALGCFAGGFFTAKKHGKKGLLMGFITSGIFFLIVTVASLTVSLESIGMLTLIHLCVMLLSGGIGGVFGVNNKKKTKI